MSTQGNRRQNISTLASNSPKRTQVVSFFVENLCGNISCLSLMHFLNNIFWKMKWRIGNGNPLANREGKHIHKNDILGYIYHTENQTKLVIFFFCLNYCCFSWPGRVKEENYHKIRVSRFKLFKVCIFFLTLKTFILSSHFVGKYSKLLFG